MNGALIASGVLGAALTVAGYFQKKKIAFLYKSGIRVDGDVVSIEERMQTDTRNRRITVYYPVIAFKTTEGEIFKKESSVGNNPSLYNEGDKVPIIYNPADPSDFITDDKSIKIYYVLFWFGIVLIAVSAGLTAVLK